MSYSKRSVRLRGGVRAAAPGPAPRCPAAAAAVGIVIAPRRALLRRLGSSVTFFFVVTMSASRGTGTSNSNTASFLELDVRERQVLRVVGLRA